MNGLEQKGDVALGLCAFTHDSSAALLLNKKLVGHVEEERLSGQKHTSHFPALSVRWLLDQIGASPSDVTSVSYNFVPSLYAPRPSDFKPYLSSFTFKRLVSRELSFWDVGRRTANRITLLKDLFPFAEIVPVAHHRAHVAYALNLLKSMPAAAIVMDSLGERQATTMWDCPTGCTGPKQIREIRDPHSLGYAYGAVTEHLGHRRGDEEGTIMALAAEGDPRRFREVFRAGIRLTDGGYELDPRYFALRVLRTGEARLTREFTQLTCVRRGAGESHSQIHADLAASLQERVEQAMIHLTTILRAHTTARTLVVTGGVAMNCVGIGRILEAELFDKVLVPPSPGDAGTALGALLATHPTALSDSGPFLGPQFPRREVDHVISGRPHLTPIDADPAYVARDLAEGAIVGVFSGPLEAGPRALGNRSILASPLHEGVVDRLNAKVKYRESFRPFAPAVLADRACEWFEVRQPLPYMSAAVQALDKTRSLMPSVVHRNGRARVQTVDRNDTSFLANVLKEFEALTDVPILINTSLNVKGKPICGIPEMALDCFDESGIDALYIEGAYLRK